jgi:DNA-binding NarL/FixJ family response regulator
MTIVLFTNDLMFQSRIAAAVRSAGGELMVARSLESLQSRLADREPSMIVFDLSFTGVDLQYTTGAMREQFPNAKQLAYGPHVDVDRLQQATALGIDEVLTRGQFDRDMMVIFSNIAPRPST